MKVNKIWFDKDSIHVETDDGKHLQQRLEVYPELYEATPVEREEFFLYDDGRAVRWEKIDLDIHISNFFEDLPVRYENEVASLLAQYPEIEMRSIASSAGMHWTKLARYKYGIWEPSSSEMNDIRKAVEHL